MQEVGLYDYRNRVYSAELGRFLQTDPMRFSANDVNVYRYVGNEVTNSVDVTGQKKKCCPSKEEYLKEKIKKSIEALQELSDAVKAYASEGSFYAALTEAERSSIVGPLTTIITEGPDNFLCGSCIALALMEESLLNKMASVDGADEAKANAYVDAIHRIETAKNGICPN